MARNVSSTSAARHAVGHLRGLRGRRPRRARPASRRGPRCADGPRARGRGSRRSRPASAGPGPRRRRRAPCGRPRATTGARRPPRAAPRVSDSPPPARARPRGDGASVAGARPWTRGGADRARWGSAGSAPRRPRRARCRSRSSRAARRGSRSLSRWLGATVCMSRVVTASRPRRTWSAPMAAARRVVSAVTRGCPSRSEPTHEPQRRKACAAGGRVPVRPLSVAAAAADGTGVLLRDPGGAVERPVERPVEARRDHEERLVEEEERRCAPRRGARDAPCAGPRCATAARSPRAGGAGSRRPRPGVMRWSSSRSRSPNTRRRATSIVRRRASVGCAVRTSPMRELGDEGLVARRAVLAKQSAHGLLRWSPPGPRRWPSGRACARAARAASPRPGWSGGSRG